MFKDFFKRRKMRVIAFGEPEVEWTNIGRNTLYSVVFYQNDNDKREYTVKSQNNIGEFDETIFSVHCETWKRTGLLPAWVKDPIAEKLSR